MGENMEEDQHVRPRGTPRETEKKREQPQKNGRGEHTREKPLSGWTASPLDSQIRSRHNTEPGYYFCSLSQ